RFQYIIAHRKETRSAVQREHEYITPCVRIFPKVLTKAVYKNPFPSTLSITNILSFVVCNFCRNDLCRRGTGALQVRSQRAIKSANFYGRWRPKWWRKTKEVCSI